MSYHPDTYGLEPMPAQLREQVQRVLKTAHLTDWEANFLSKLLQTQEVSSRQRDVAKKIIIKTVGS